MLCDEAVFTELLLNLVQQTSVQVFGYRAEAKAWSLGESMTSSVPSH